MSPNSPGPLTRALIIFASLTAALTFTGCKSFSAGPDNISGNQSSQAPLISSPSSARKNLIPPGLHTWWHDQFEQNTASAVASNKVRRSHLYDVRVATPDAPTNYQNSFVYMSIPRSGKAKQDYSHEDGAEFATSAQLSMSWSSFLYDSDVWLEVDLKDGASVTNLDQVIIRPTTLAFEKQWVDANTIRIKVPYSAKGQRFSVEFESQQFTSYNNNKTIGGQITLDSNGYAIHREPKNALLIFAQPNYTPASYAELVPDSGDIHYPAPGEINLDAVTADIIYFKPGIYFMDWNYHAYLPSEVKWIYLAPGAYVKGAFQFRDGQSHYKVTGYGILSGEQYVYEADTTNAYQHRRANKSNCHIDCVKMLRFQSGSAQQDLRLQGITINEPPYHSFVTYGDEDSFTMDVSEFQQVGSWYWQTDGLELYQGSRMENAFFHANDDVLKLYHSDLSLNNVVIWKGENGPVIQFGWWPRNMHNIEVKNIQVIHNRMFWSDSKHNSCIINAANNWTAAAGSDNWDKTADLNAYVKNVNFENIRSEGMNLCAMRFYALSHWEGINIRGLDIERWNELPKGGQQSLFKIMGDANGTKVNITPGNGVNIKNYLVQSQPITKGNNNWSAEQHGRISFDAALDDSWNAVADVTAQCQLQNISLELVDSLPINESLIISAVNDSGLPLSLSAAGAARLEATTLIAAATPGTATLRIEQAGNEIYCPGSYLVQINIFDPQQGPGERWIGASWLNWSPGELPMMWNNSDQVYQVITPITSGTHQFKFTNTSNWSGDDWGNAEGLSGTVNKTSGGGANISFTIPITGDYLIIFDPYTFAYAVVSQPLHPAKSEVSH